MTSQSAASLLSPIARGVTSVTFNPTNRNPSQTPVGELSTVPASRRKIFKNQENPIPIEFGDLNDLVETVNLNSSAFFRLNPHTTSVAASVGTFLTFADSVIQSMRNAGKLETELRRSCIEAVVSMKRLNLPDPPAAMGVMLVKGKSTNVGWQFWIHSSIKGARPPRGGQAKLAPVLEQRLRKVGYEHHFSSMCAEMALLTDYLDNYYPMEGEALFDREEKLRPWGEKVYMMTYNTSVMASGDDGTGKYLNPCRHSEKACAGRGKSHRGNVGCADVLELLGVEVIGKGKPSERDVRILVEQGLLPPKMLKKFPPPVQQAVGSLQANPQGVESEGAITPIVVGEHPPGQWLQGEDPLLQLKTNQPDAVMSGIPFAPVYPKMKETKGGKMTAGGAAASTKAPDS